MPMTDGERRSRRQSKKGAAPFLSWAARRVARTARPPTKGEAERVAELLELWRLILVRRDGLVAAIEDKRHRGIQLSSAGDQRALDALDLLLARYSEKRDVLTGARGIALRPKWFPLAAKVRIVGELFRLQIEHADSPADAAEVFSSRSPFPGDLERAASALGVSIERLCALLLLDEVQILFKERGPHPATLLASSKLFGGSIRNLDRHLKRLEDYEHTHGVRVGIPPPAPLTR